MLVLRSPNGKSVGVASKSWPLKGSYTPNAYNSPTIDMRLLGGDVQTFIELYRTQPWVYTVVNKLARGIARLPLRTYRIDGDGNREEVPSSVPAKLIRNPYTRAGRFALIEFIIGQLCVFGNATLVKYRGGQGQTPAELWPMPFHRVNIVTGADTPISAYVWNGLDVSGGGGARKVFVPDDIVHFSWFHPEGRPWGVSPLEALATTLALEEAGQRYSIASFMNNARPSSFITSEKLLNKDQREALRAEIDAAYGGVDNAFKVALLDNGLDWKPIAHSARDSSLVELRQLSREEVCAVFDVPPPMVGILDNATYSNIEEQHLMLYQTTIAPILAMVEDIFNVQLVSEEAAWDGYFVEFDMNEVVRGSLTERSQAYARLLASGVYTPNGLRKLENLPPIGDPDDQDHPANAIYVPVNTEPVGKDGMLRPLQQERVNVNENVDPLTGEPVQPAPLPTT